MKSKLKKLVLKIVFTYALMFPSSGLIEQHKTIEEMEEDDEIHIGI